MPGDGGEPRDAIGAAAGSDEWETDPSGTPISPYLPPKRRSVLPKTPDIRVYPSGVVARPVEEYLVRDESAEGAPPSGVAAPGDVPAGRQIEEPVAVAQGGGSRDSGGGGSVGGRFNGGFGSWLGRIPRGALVGGVVVVAFGLGIGIMALAGGAGPSPSVGPSESPHPLPNPTMVSYFDDGIADDAYPAAATWRGEGYPQALQMEDWVWDSVGPGWALVLFGRATGTDSSGGDAPPTPVVYLVSPEGVYFELAELPQKVADGPQLVSWHEADREARIVWDFASEGGLLDLTAGGVDETNFQMSSGRTYNVQFLAGNAAGDEVWMARGSDGLENRFELWPNKSPWERILVGQNDLYLEWFTFPASPSGSAIALQVYSTADPAVASARSGPPGEPRLVVYSLDTGEDRFIRPQMPMAHPSCTYLGWIDDSSVGYACWDAATSTQTDYQLFVDGTDRVEPYEWPTPWFADISSGEIVQVPDSNLEVVGSPAGGTIIAVRLLTDSGPISLVDAAMLGPEGGKIESFDQVAPGVFRLVTWDAIVIGIDTRAATIGPTILPATPDGSPLMPHSYVFFGEASPPRAGIVWGE